MILMGKSKQEIVYFTGEQLAEIYEATGRSSDVAIIRAKASEMYPDIVDDEGVPIWKLPSHGRSFDRGDGTYEMPAFVLTSNKCNSMGVMKDGTPRPF